jgi:hypothetical protein
VRWHLVLKKKFKRKVDLVPYDCAYPKVLENAEIDKILLYQI